MTLRERQNRSQCRAATEVHIGEGNDSIRGRTKIRPPLDLHQAGPSAGLRLEMGGTGEVLRVWARRAVSNFCIGVRTVPGGSHDGVQIVHALEVGRSEDVVPLRKEPVDFILKLSVCFRMGG